MKIKPIIKSASRTLKSSYLKCITALMTVLILYICLIFFEAIFDSIIGETAVKSATFAIYIIIIMPLILGVKRMYFMMCKNTSADINDCFIYFSSSKLFFKGLTLQLIKKSIILASIAILVVPFIAAAFAYVQTPIICAVMLGLSAIGTAVTLRINLSLFLSDYCFFICHRPLRSIRLSAKMMKHQRGELLTLFIKLLPLYISCILILPVFYVAPLYMTAAAYYSKIIIYRFSLRSRSTDIEQQDV